MVYKSEGERKTVGTNLCFRPTNEFLGRLENFMAIHHLNDKSDAIRMILEEWQEQKKELETLRDYLQKASPQPTQTMKPLDCLKGLKFADIKNQQIGCSICKKREPEIYNECQSLKQQQKGV